MKEKQPGERVRRRNARAGEAEETATAIREAALGLFRALPFEQVTLEAIAARAGVTLQTVLHRFGSQQGLFDAMAKMLSAETAASRVPACKGHVGLAVATLVDSYEVMGDIGWSALCQEEESEFIHELLQNARANHRAWLESTFASALEGVSDSERDRRSLMLFSTTDYYVYRLLHRDLGNNNGEIVRIMTDLVSAVLRSFQHDRTEGGAV